VPERTGVNNVTDSKISKDVFQLYVMVMIE